MGLWGCRVTDENRMQLFDEWAETSDGSVRSQEGFPFAGYDEVLARVVALARPRRGLRVLDLGVGTGLLAERLARDHLSCTGRMVIGDVSFPDAAERDAAHLEWGEPGPEPGPEWKASRWDEDEHYWVADDAVRALSGVGLKTSYRQVSFCGGVYVIEPVDRARRGRRVDAHIP